MGLRAEFALSTVATVTNAIDKIYERLWQYDLVEKISLANVSESDVKSP